MTPDLGIPTTLVRVVKLLELTTSTHDGEALAAIRKANQDRERLGFTWTEIIIERSLSESMRKQAPKRRHKRPRNTCWTAPDGTPWKTVFETIFGNLTLSDHWLEVLDSIHNFYAAHGYITAKQSTLTLKFLATARERAAA